jgi:hypothetical protein
MAAVEKGACGICQHFENLDMKHFFLFSILALGLFLTACGNKAETTTAGEQPVMSADSAGGAPSVSTEAPTGATATGSATGEAHYKCTKAGCTGTGDAAGKCPVCGGDLAHNPAFHNQAPGSTPQNAVTLDPSTGKPAGATATTATPTPPAAKNEKGIFHYTCTKAGCDGGGGAAGKCPKCGSDLAHNQAYHNK